jgi:uncharacterized cupredoxin-like copper-binding protein
VQRTAWRIGFALIVVAALIGGGLALSGDTAERVTMIKVSLKEFSFTPKAVTVAPGPVRFVLTNNGTIDHDFMIKELKIDSGMVKPGTSVTVPAAGKPPVVLKKGTYQAYCNVPGHKETGMIMTITVK